MIALDFNAFGKSKWGLESDFIGSSLEMRSNLSDSLLNDYIVINISLSALFMILLSPKSKFNVLVCGVNGGGELPR